LKKKRRKLAIFFTWFKQKIIEGCLNILFPYLELAKSFCGLLPLWLHHRINPKQKTLVCPEPLARPILVVQ
jgi:hypothetical protein